MIDVNPEKDLLSGGRLSAMLRISPARLEQAAAAAGVDVVMRINGTAYFAANGVDRLASALAAISSPANKTKE